MSIKYYPWRSPRAAKPAIDSVMEQPESIVASGSQDLTSVALAEVIYCSSDWKIDTIAMGFGVSVSKTHSASVKNGRIVVAGLNDYLWFIASGFYPTKITLDEGFYSGTELAAHLASKLDTEFSPATFTVDYGVTTDDKFTIVPSAGNIKYIEFNLQGPKGDKQSIAGHLFGFEEDTGFSAVSIESDTDVPALDLVVPIFNTSGTATSVYASDGYIMDIDQALLLGVTVAATTVNWSVTYEKRV